MITQAMESSIGKRYAAERYHVWTAPLAPQIPLADLVNHEPERNKWMTAPVGMLDLPTLAQQQPLMLNLTGTHGHLLLVGASRSGKTTLLRTLMLALAIHHSPADLWIYTIDPSGRACGMALPADADADSNDGVLPHVADMLTPQDTARIERLLVELNALISDRRELLRQYGADTLAQYRQQYRTKPTPDAPPPDILLVIDGLAELVGAQSEATIDALKTLIREAAPFGIACVVTASLARDVSGWLGLFETRIALRLTDENDSDLLIGKKFAARIRAEQPGRAFLRTSDGPVELQIALPVLRKSRQAATNTTADADEVLYSDLPDELKYALRVMSRRYRAVQVGRPNPLRLLPGRVDLSDLLAETVAPAIPFARDSLTLRPVNLRLDDGTPHLLIAGGPDSGKSEALRTLLSALTLRYSPDEAQLVLIDYRSTTLLPFADLPHTRPWDIEVPIDSIPPWNTFSTSKKEASTLRIASNEAELAGLLMALRTKLTERNRTKQKRPRFILIVNDLDLMIGKEQEYLSLLAAFAMRGSEIGLHIILTATDFAAWNSSQLVKAIRTERCSLYLGKPPEMGSDILNVGNTGIKWSKAFAKADFPPGRGLALLRGQHMLVQVAFAGPSIPTPQNEPSAQPEGTEPSADQTLLPLQESVSEYVLVPQEHE
jgi:S-DNA-T family DNA segregation ATPase FtsK/SpoIIIE